MSGSPRLKIAHISDLHFAYPANHSNDRRHDWSLLEAATSLINEQSPTHLIVSGDVSNSGDEHSLSQARLWMTREIYDEKYIGLRFDEKRIIVVPGNHDAWNMAAPGIIGRQQSLSSFFKVFNADFSDLQPHGVSYKWLKGDTIDVMLMYADSSFFGDPETDNGYFLNEIARGKISVRQSQELLSLYDKGVAGKLEDHDGTEEISPATFQRSLKIFVMHHYLFPPPGKKWEPFLDIYDRKLIFQNFAMAGIDIVLCGHKHQHGFDVHFWNEHFSGHRAKKRLLLNCLRRRIGARAIPRVRLERGRKSPRILNLFATLFAWLRNNEAPDEHDHDHNQVPEAGAASVAFAARIIDLLDRPKQLREFLLEEIGNKSLEGVVTKEEVDDIYEQLFGKFNSKDLQKLAETLRPHMRSVLDALEKRGLLQIMCGSTTKVHTKSSTSRSLNFYEISDMGEEIELKMSRYVWNGEKFAGPNIQKQSFSRSVL